MRDLILNGKTKPAQLPDFQTFNFNGRPIYALTINGVLWFRAFEAASILGYAKPRNAIKMHVEFKDKKDINLKKLFKNQAGALNQRGLSNQTAVYINESGLYSLILDSRLPEAKAFRLWLFKEVLPAIRKTGRYSTAQAQLPAPSLSDPAAAARAWADEAEQKRRASKELRHE